MDDDPDYNDGDMTAGGSQIIMGKARAQGWTPPESYAENCELIEAHLAPIFGEEASVFHEMVSDLIHLDVLAYAPNADRDYWVYVTSGMGDLRMVVPDGIDATDWGRAELMIALPRVWGDKIAAKNVVGGEDPDTLFWPIGLMKWLARYPHEAQTWFAEGHTIPNGEPYDEGSGLSGAMFGYSSLLPEAEQRMQLPGGDWLNFYGVTLLFPEEMDFKLSDGFDGLCARLRKAGANELVAPHRNLLSARTLFCVFWGWADR